MINQDFFISYSSLTDKFGLTDHALKIATLLIKATNFNTKSSYMSKKTMAAKCGCSTSTVTRAIRHLVKLNLVTVSACMKDRKNNSIKRQTSNDYYINLNLLTDTGYKIKAAGECIELAPSELTVYNFIAKKVGTRNNFSISKAEIAKKCKLSISSVFYAIKKLESKSMILVSRTKLNKAAQCNDYSLIYKERSNCMKSEKRKTKLLANTSRLSAQAHKLFEYLVSCENYDCLCNEQQLSKRSHVSISDLPKAIKELEHYQLVSRWHSCTNRNLQKWHYTLSAMLEEDEFPNALPPLPKDVTNGEPFKVELKGNIFELSRFTPADVKLYAAMRYLSPNNSNLSVDALSDTCYLKQADFTASLSKFIKVKYIIKDGDAICFSKSPASAWPLFKGNQYFKLPPVQFTILLFLFIISEQNNKVFITTRSISQYCKINPRAVHSSIKQLVVKSVIKTSIFKQTDGGIAGRIIELVDKNDMGVSK